MIIALCKAQNTIHPTNEDRPATPASPVNVIAIAIQNNTGKHWKITLPPAEITSPKIFCKVLMWSPVPAVAVIAEPIPKNNPAIGNIAIGNIKPRDNLAINSFIDPEFSLFWCCLRLKICANFICFLKFNMLII